MEYKQLNNYKIYEDGSVFSEYKKDFMNPMLYKRNKQGNKVKYMRVALSLPTGRKKFAIHRLVAENFLPNPDNLPHVNHKDGDRWNNHYSNLEWCDHEMNIIHRDENNLNPKGEDHGIAVATEEIVREIRRLRMESDITYPELAKMFNLKESTVGAIGRYQNWKHIE